MSGSAYFKQFVAFDAGCGHMCEFLDEARTGGAVRLAMAEPWMLRDAQPPGGDPLDNQHGAYFEPYQNRVFIDEMASFHPQIVSFGPLSQVGRCTPQQQSSMFIPLLRRFLQVERKRVVAGPKALHRYVNVSRGANPLLGQYMIFRDGLAMFARETVSILD